MLSAKSMITNLPVQQNRKVGASLSNIMWEQALETAAAEKLVAIEGCEFQPPKPLDRVDRPPGASKEWLGEGHCIANHLLVALKQPMRDTLEERRREIQKRSARKTVVKAKPSKPSNIFDLLSDESGDESGKE